MVKKYIFVVISFLTLFYLSYDWVSAYEFINQSNASSVMEKINEIYLAKEQYEDLAGGYDVVDLIDVSSSNTYWWPIGSSETSIDSNGRLFAIGTPMSINITSYFNSQESFRKKGHGAIDINSNGYGTGVVNVIAAKAGVVIYPTNVTQTLYKDNVGNGLGNKDGGGYGNYVKIQHADGTYTLYGHLAYNSITVIAGDVVEQGQVIAKLGHTGNSTGPHLHFEVRKGGDSGSNRVDPLEYVDPLNPRPTTYGSGNSFSLSQTSLTKEEFVSKMNDYCTRSNNKGFCNNFSKNAEEIYDTSLNNNINPELVVVVAGSEQNWTLSSACQYTNNYWGIGIKDGGSCNSGEIYDSISEGISSYASIIFDYMESGKYASAITSAYNERSNASCESVGYGLPGTLQGMQSILSNIGTYRINPGSKELGGCYYLSLVYGTNYCTSVPTCIGGDSCGETSIITTCEKNDYTSWQLRKKLQIRYDVFGL